MLFAAGIFLFAAGLLTSVLIVRRQNAIQRFSRFDVNYAVSATALAVVRLEAAVGALAAGHGDPDAVQLRLNIALNRLNIIQQNEPVSFLRTVPGGIEAVDRLRAVLAAVQPLGASLAEPEGAARMLERLFPLETSFARVAGLANTRSSELAVQDQKELGALHWLFSGIIAGLTACSFGLVWLLSRHNRLLDAAHRRVQMLVGNLHAAGENLAQANTRVEAAMREVQSQNVVLQARDVALNEQNARFDAALNSMSQGLCMVNGDEELIVCNRRFLEIFGISADVARAELPIREVFGAIAAGGGISGALLDGLVAEQAALIREARAGSFLREDGDGRAIAVSLQPMAAGGWTATYEDATDRRRAETHLHYMAHHDALTRLPNRVRLREQLDLALRGRAGEAGSLAVLCLDLDRFKNVNDTLGHPAGDALLEAVSGRLAACLRREDFVARLGGDEFAIVQVAPGQPAAAEALAAGIIEVLREPYDVRGARALIGASVGIAVADAADLTADILLKRADMALYKAKEAGRGQHRVFAPEMDARLQARLGIEFDLRDALGREEMLALYQPIMDVAAGRVSGFEALLRWHHPARGLVSPADFIPVAEETGMIHAIGAWMLERACADAAAWPEWVSVAVNLSPVQVRRGADLAADVRRALDRSGLPAGRLELEITESALLDDSEAVLATLHGLRALGLRIALDDFGTGYSSLSHLCGFPFDKIKIDQSFVRGIMERPDCLAIVQSVVGLAQRLGAKTVAEGVETEAQLRQLRDIGCTEVQGYLFDRPRDLAATARWFQQGASPPGPAAPQGKTAPPRPLPVAQTELAAAR